MKKDIADKWIKALTSGKYEQGTGILKPKTSEGGPAFCCLGVLCDISKQGSWTNKGYETVDECTRNLLPTSIQTWAQMTSGDGSLENRAGEYTSLAQLNDEGASFAEIAKIIKKHWRQL